MHLLEIFYAGVNNSSDISGADLMDDVIYRRLNSAGVLFPYQLMPEVLKTKLRLYGFVECSSLIAFIDLFCIPYPDRSALAYILGKTEGCLINHDNGSNYFNGLKVIVLDIKDWLELCERIQRKRME